MFTEKKKDQIETMLMIVGMAAMGAIGILGLFCAAVEIELYYLGTEIIAGMLFGLTGFLFGIISLITTSSRRKKN